MILLYIYIYIFMPELLSHFTGYGSCISAVAVASNFLMSAFKTGPEVHQTEGHRRRLRCLWIRQFMLSIYLLK